MANERTCVVVGAGISGLLAATQLQANGWRVTVIDKGRGPGGRMATRRFAGAYFDHGAQFFTVRTPEFAAFVDTWRANGTVGVWSNGFPSSLDAEHIDGHPRFRGLPSMTAITKLLAADLDVRLSTRVTAVRQFDAKWYLSTETGAEFAAEHVLLTSPVPQSLQLLDSGGVVLPSSVRTALEAITYDPCFALMAIVPQQTKIPAPGALQLRTEPISWIADNTKKGVSPGVHALTIHAGPAFTRAHLHAARDDVAQKLLHAAREWIGTDIVQYQIHRWLYSQPVKPYPQRSLIVEQKPPIGFAGDAFGGPRVEGAALSGLDAAANLMRVSSR